MIDENGEVKTRHTTYLVASSETESLAPRSGTLKMFLRQFAKWEERRGFKRRTASEAHRQITTAAACK